MKARLPQWRGNMVRDGARAPPHHEDRAIPPRKICRAMPRICVLRFGATGGMLLAKSKRISGSQHSCPQCHPPPQNHPGLTTLSSAARVFEQGSGRGGTWDWNRYPGARWDVESMQYSYSFSDELQQEWDWSER